MDVEKTSRKRQAESSMIYNERLGINDLNSEVTITQYFSRGEYNIPKNINFFCKKCNKEKNRENCKALRLYMRKNSYRIKNVYIKCADCEEDLGSINELV